MVQGRMPHTAEQADKHSMKWIWFTNHLFTNLSLWKNWWNVLEGETFQMFSHGISKGFCCWLRYYTRGGQWQMFVFWLDNRHPHSRSSPSKEKLFTLVMVSFLCFVFFLLRRRPYFSWKMQLPQFFRLFYCCTSNSTVFAAQQQTCCFVP